MRKEIKEMREKNPEEYMIKKKTEMLQALAIKNCKPFTSYTELIMKLDNNSTKLNLFLVNSCQVLLKEKKF